MSRIDDLIQELCSDGVRFYKVGDLSQVGTGNSDRKDATGDGEYPFYVRSKDVMRIDSYEFDEEALLIPGEGGIGEIFHYVNGKYALHQRAYRIHFTDIRVDSKFAYFYFAANFKRFILQKAVSATVTSIRKPMIADFPFPVPPLEVQREIVRILDQFTQLEAELEAELEARRAQYEYYRQRLIDQVEADSVPVGDLGRWYGGMTPSKGNPVFWDSGTIPWLASMDVSDEGSDGIRGRITEFALEQTSARLIPAPSIAVVMRSNILRRRLPIGLVKVDTTVNQDIRALVPNSNVDATYVYQVLRADSERIRSRWVRTDGSMAAVDSKGFFGWRIPLPPLEEQRRIANDLQYFDALVNDLSIGLPAELSARRKQYEHYLDRLLTFKELAA